MGSFQTIITLAVIFGVCPWKQPVTGKQKHAIVLLRLAYLLAFLGLSAVACQKCNLAHYRYFASLVSANWALVNCTLFFCISYTAPLLYAKQYRGIFKQLLDVDTVIESHRLKLKHSWKQVLVYAVQVSFTLLSLYQFFGNLFALKKANFCTLYYSGSKVVSLVVQLVFLGLLFEVHARFEALNRFLRSVAACSRTRPGPKLARDCQLASNVHYALVQITRGVNAVLQLQFAAKLLSFFCFFVIFLFYLTAEEDAFQDRFATPTVYWRNFFAILAFFSEICSVIALCTGVVDESKKTVDILHSIQHQDAYLIQSFSQQLYVTKVTFAVFEMFPIDWSLLFTMLLSAMMYAIFFMQLSGGQKYIIYFVS